MDGLYLNPILGFVVRIVIYGWYLKRPKLFGGNCYMILEN
jgi:hypothetical protein